MSFSATIIILIQELKSIIEAISAALCVDYPPYWFAGKVATLQGARRILVSHFRCLYV
jgi:hypothetical protein